MKLCPSCGAELNESETKCPICDFVLAKVEERAPIDVDVVSKLNEMKAKIEKLAKEADEGPGAEEPPVQEGEHFEPREAEYKTPGAVEEEALQGGQEEAEYEEVVVGEVTPIRRSAVNGIGMPTPKAKGMPKPEKVAYKISAVEPAKEKVEKKHVAIAIILVIALVLVSWMILVSQSNPMTPNVDGTFDEWGSIVKYASFFHSSDVNLDFTECAVQYYHNMVYWYFQTSGELYKTSDRITTYALFIDSDGNPATGFSLLPAFGADYVAQVSGIGGGWLNGQSVLLEHRGTDTTNYSSWDSVQSLPVGSIVKRAETAFTAPASLLLTDAKFMVVSYDGVASPSATLPFAMNPGILLVEQTTMVGASDIIPSAAGTKILKLSVKGFGAIHGVEVITPTVTGATLSASVGSIIWTDENDMGTGRTIEVKVNTTVSAPGTLVTAGISLAGIVSEYDSVIILGTPAKGYVTAFPAGVSIDGCFADWSVFQNDIGDVVPVPNGDIDMRRVGHQSDSAKAYFYVDTAGIMLNGTLIPVEKRKSAEGGGSGVPPGPQKKVSGEDVLQIFIDIDPSASVGALPPVNGTTLRPDYMIELHGRNGLISFKMLYKWAVNRWTTTSLSAVDAMSDRHRMELSVVKSYVGGSVNHSDVAYVLSDWSGGNDNFSESGIIIDPFKVDLNGKIWGSLDGTSWTPKADVLVGTSTLVDLTSDAAGNLYAAFTNGTVYVSYDAAMSWSRLIQGALTDVAGITSDRASMLYIMLSNGSSYASTTSGGAWTHRGAAPIGTGYVDIDWVSGTTPDSTVLFAIKSTSNSKIPRSSDGGIKWTPQVNKPPTDSDVAAVGVMQSGGNELIYVLEADGDVRVSNDSGTSWTSTHISPGGGSDFSLDPCTDLDIDDSGNAWVVRSKGEVYKLSVSPWGWQTIYSAQDIQGVQAFSTTPVPEFSGISIAVIALIVIPIVILSRKSGKRA